MRSINPTDLTKDEQYKLLTGAVVPRPIALVTTTGPLGVNAAPFSFFNVVGVLPPMLMFSVGMREDAEKDTVRNLREIPEMVVHIAGFANAVPMNKCGAALPYGRNELDIAGFETIPADVVRPPRIAACPVHFECVLDRLLPFGEVPYTLVIARIVRMHFRDGIVDSRYYVDAAALDAVGRTTGAGMYLRTADRFGLPNPDIAIEDSATST